MQKSWFTLNRFLDFSSRSSRTEYWLFTLFSFLAGVIGGVIDGIISRHDMTVTVIFVLALIVPTLSVTVRRLHDIDRSGWWLLAFFAATSLLRALSTDSTRTGNNDAAGAYGFLFIITWGVYLFAMLKPGTDGPNAFGPIPATENTQAAPAFFAGVTNVFAAKGNVNDLEALDKYYDLYQKGALTEEEYQKVKKSLLEKMRT